MQICLIRAIIPFSSIWLTFFYLGPPKLQALSLSSSCVWLGPTGLVYRTCDWKQNKVLLSCMCGVGVGMGWNGALRTYNITELKLLQLQSDEFIMSMYSVEFLSKFRVTWSETRITCCRNQDKVWCTATYHFPDCCSGIQFFVGTPATAATRKLDIDMNTSACLISSRPVVGGGVLMVMRRAKVQQKELVARLTWWKRQAAFSLQKLNPRTHHLPNPSSSSSPPSPAPPHAWSSGFMMISASQPAKSNSIFSIDLPL